MTHAVSPPRPHLRARPYYESLGPFWPHPFADTQPVEPPSQGTGPQSEGEMLMVFLPPEVWLRGLNKNYPLPAK